MTKAVSTTMGVVHTDVLQQVETVCKVESVCRTQPASCLICVVQAYRLLYHSQQDQLSLNMIV